MRREDVLFRDVKTKFPDRNGTREVNDVMPRSVGWGFWDLRKSCELSSCLRTRKLRFRPGRGQMTWCTTGAVRWLGESWQCKSSQHRKIVSLSPHVKKPLTQRAFVQIFIGLYWLKIRICIIYFISENRKYTQYLEQTHGHVHTKMALAFSQNKLTLGGIEI